ncbi:MAG TPA: tripartite tricarboxylate transporter substrate binding protein [Casimicrobiaceae bacterium]|nr:tripartite tricarboxylate transporter substrate binding protein [Casimicrobiaceae bacterium]
MKSLRWLFVALMPALAFAQGYPDRPIKLIVPYPPGGSTDPVARILATDIGTRIGQPIVVDNRPGAAGSIGTEAVARAAPDGYTILLHTSVIATDPTLKKNATYDVKRDLTPITLAVTGPYLVVVNPSLPVKNIAELIAYAKANPGKLFYGSAGTGSSGHLIGELFKQAAGIDMTHVPYKGGGPSITGLMGNEVQLLFDTLGGSRALAESGRLRAIAVTSPQRSPVMPNVPTVSESGLKGFEAVYWLGIFAPAKTPQPIIDKLYREIKISLDDPAIKTKLLDQGNVAQALPPAEFAKVLDSDIQRYKTVIETAKIQLE